MLNKFLVFTISFFIFNSSLAIPPESVKEDQTPPLISAVLKEDPELYSKEMENLLYGSIKQFIKTIQFKTKEGDTIFYLMAKVQSHREFFIRELKNLISAFSPAKSGGKLLSLGDIKIPILFLETTDLGQAIEQRDISSALLIANKLDSTFAIVWFQNLHARTQKGQSLKNFVFNHLQVDQIMYLRGKILEQNIEKKLSISSFLLTDSYEGFLPKDVAYELEHSPVYIFPSNRMEKVEAHSDKNFKEGLFLGVVTAKCYDFFQKMKANKLRNKSI
ncbi:MAG: hypothetical protein OXN83_05030 [Oligoflexia bacterium]|nr:hypothetical protein [Oligoflexia bacterium]